MMVSGVQPLLHIFGTVEPPRYHLPVKRPRIFISQIYADRKPTDKPNTYDSRL